jgi:hypothetical protein
METRLGAAGGRETTPSLLPRKSRMRLRRASQRDGRLLLKEEEKVLSKNKRDLDRAQIYIIHSSVTLKLSQQQFLLLCELELA